MKHYDKRLYSKFKTRMLNTLNTDSFYEYFMKALESSARVYGQKNVRLVKTVDKVWVDALYDTLPALDEIVNKPKRFIERNEVIVPIELARKVGADSVKHLATHTQYISQVDQGGNVIPNKIMNIYNEDSFDLYENRFIVTLIQRACSFVDQRYDAVAELGGDEFRADFKMDSTLTDNDEKIEYNLALNIHQGSAYLGGKGNNDEILEKLDHIRMMYTSLKRSEFYQSLSGCTPVKSPISRTNLIVKNPHFIQCYSLWNFLENYSGVGYSIEEYQSDEEFDQEYVNELNSMMLFSYLILKNKLDEEHNKAPDLTGKKKRVIKPKYKIKTTGEKDPDHDLELPALKEEAPETPSEESIHHQQDHILAALARALHDEHILAALEKALNDELNKTEDEIAEPEEEITGEPVEDDGVKTAEENLVHDILVKFLEEEIEKIKQNA